MYLSHNIVIIRKLLGDTQAQFAERFIGVTVGMQKSYEKGTTPSILYMSKLSKLSGVSVDELQVKKLDPDKVNIVKEENEEDDQGEKEKLDLVDDRVELKEAMGTIRGYNVFLQKMLETSLGNILRDQIGSSALIAELLRRDFQREAAGNADVLKQILEEFLQRIGPKVSSSVMQDIAAGDGRKDKRVP